MRTGVMIHPHVVHLDTAFLQLSFALKLIRYLDDHPVNKKEFDISLTFEDDRSRICLPHGEFHTYDDIKGAACNNFQICFGAAAITLWEAFREKGYSSKNIDPSRNDKENLVSLSYMIRCCFA